VVTDICNVLVAKTRHLDPYTKEGWSHFAFFCILLGQRTKCAYSQHSSADSSMVKRPRAILQCSQAVKVTVKFLDPVLAV